MCSISRDEIIILTRLSLPPPVECAPVSTRRNRKENIYTYNKSEVSEWREN